MEVLDYETLVADFESKLVTQLRNFGAGADYLEMWVPDQDPVKSILNMVEAADAFGRGNIAVRVGSNTLSGSQLDSLMAQVGDLGRVEVQDERAGKLIIVTNIGSRP